LYAQGSPFTPNSNKQYAYLLTDGSLVSDTSTVALETRSITIGFSIMQAVDSGG